MSRAPAPRVVFDPAELWSVGKEGGGVGGHMQLAGNVIAWVMPEGRSRVYEISEVLPAGPGVVFAFMDRRGRTFELRRLTVALYNASVRLPGHPRYRSHAEMVDAYWQSLGYPRTPSNMRRTKSTTTKRRSIRSSSKRQRAASARVPKPGATRAKTSRSKRKRRRN